MIKKIPQSQSQLSVLMPTGAEVVGTSASLPWTGFVVEKFSMQPGERLSGTTRWHVISALGNRPAIFEGRTSTGSLSTFTKPPGALTFFPIGEIPAVRLRSWSELLSCAVDEEMVRSTRDEIGGHKSDELLYRSGIRDDAAERLVSLLTIEMESGGLSGRLYSESLVRALVCRYLILASADARSSSPAAGTMHPRLLKGLREWMEENAHKDISLSAMAKEAKYSPTHLLRIFRASTGLTPHQYLLQLRIEKAERLLKKKDASLIDVAIECGFSSQAHLSSVFKTHNGMTPGQYHRHYSL